MIAWARTALGAGVAVALLPATALGATYTVTDTVDTPPGQDCGGFTGCSLREAITSANASVGVDDTVLVQAGSYALTQGQLTVTDTLSIERDGAGSVVVDANGASRVIESVGAGTALSLADLELREGQVTADPARGAGILAAGRLTLTRVEVRASTATSPGGVAEGGGIHQAGGAPTTITDSTISGNVATGATSAAGAGVFTAGSTTLTNVTVTDNTASSNGTTRGGGLRAIGDLLVSVSTFATNHVTSPVGIVEGGAVAATGTSVAVQGSVVRGNDAIGPQATGGGLWRGPSGGPDSMSLTNTRVRDNVASGGFSTAGGAYLNGTAAVVIGSTLDGNRAVATASNGAAAGGGLAIGGNGGVQLVNSTLHGNEVRAEGSGNSAIGGGLYLVPSGSIVAGATITANVASGSGVVIAGGGVAMVNGAQTLQLAGAIVSGNVQPAGNADCASATLVSSGGNLVNQADGVSGCSYAATLGDVVTADPELGPLADNGGLTPTAMPAPTSPAIDRYGPGGICPDDDQRGVARPQGPACDSGAVEARPPTVTPTPAAIAFPDRIVGETSAAQAVTFANGGDLPATGLALALVGADPADFTLSADTCSGTLAAGATCTIDVAFAPTASGARSAQLFGGDALVGLTGTGLAQPTPPAQPATPPRCDDREAAITSGSQATLTLRCSPTTWRWEIVDAPQHGRLSAIERDGTIRYTPEPGFSGHDAFRYRALGPAGASAPATVRLTVTSTRAPEPPAVDETPIPTEPPLVCGRVPDLTGRTVPGARRKLARIGCGAVPLSVTRKGRRGERPRRIVRQSPEAGAPLFEGDRLEVLARRARRTGR